MKHYRLVVLIIASRGKTYDMLTDVWMKYMRRSKHIKCFFVYGKNSNIKKEISPYSIRAPYPETYIPGILNKTLHGFRWINKHYTYDYLLRTNLSSFFVFNKLLRRLNTLPRNNCCCAKFFISELHGDVFPAGDGFILTPDVVRKILSHEDLLDKTMIDDVAIGKLLNTLDILYINNERALLKNKRIQQKVNKNYHIRMKHALKTHPRIGFYLIKRFYLGKG